MTMLSKNKSIDAIRKLILTAILENNNNNNNRISILDLQKYILYNYNVDVSATLGHQVEILNKCGTLRRQAGLPSDKYSVTYYGKSIDIDKTEFNIIEDYIDPQVLDKCILNILHTVHYQDYPNFQTWYVKSTLSVFCIYEQLKTMFNNISIVAVELRIIKLINSKDISVRIEWPRDYNKPKIHKHIYGISNKSITIINKELASTLNVIFGEQPNEF